MPDDEDDATRTARLGIRKPRRAQSPTERELQSESSRRSRSFPVHVEHEITGNYSGDELADARRLRAERDPVAAIVRLEEKHEDLAKLVEKEQTARQADSSATRTELANTRLELASTNVKLGVVSGQLSVIPDLVGALRESSKARSAIEHVQVTTALEVSKEVQLDPIRARAERRKRITTLLAAVVGAPALWEILKYFATR